MFSNIRSRRSVKKFSSKKVPENILRRLLEAAIWAPSAHNAQPWRFVVVTDRELKHSLAEGMAGEWAKDLARDGVSPDISKSLVEASIERFVQAPVLIVASLTMEEMDRYPDGKRQEFEHLMATQSLAAAIQNILLAAHSEGLGSHWFCAPLFCQDVVRKVLGIPLDVEPQALITVGYPLEEPDAPHRKPLEEVVFRDRWGGKF
ncbi:MAG: nitroreductase family protein [Nitrososphaerota archaeon]